MYMSLGEPRVMSPVEIMDFEQSEKCQRSWYAKSLMLTIASIREEHYYELELVKSQIGELQSRVKWFEETYSTRALQPLRAPRHAGLHCPHCKRQGAAKITNDGTEFWCCMDCSETWERKAMGDMAPSRTDLLPLFSQPNLAEAVTTTN